MTRFERHKYLCELQSNLAADQLRAELKAAHDKNRADTLSFGVDIISAQMSAQLSAILMAGILKP
jgi:hypothetical protein